MLSKSFLECMKCIDYGIKQFSNIYSWCNIKFRVLDVCPDVRFSSLATCNHHVKKRMPGLHDGTKVMDLDQKPIPLGSSFLVLILFSMNNVMPCITDVGVVINGS